MNNKASGRARHDRNVYLQNRCKHPLEELAKYGNQWVAWSADGSRIVAHHEDALEVTRMVDAAGIDSEDVVLEWIPPGGEVQTLL